MRPLQSRVLLTDLIFNRFEGQVQETPHYTVVKTPAQPDFFWGNYVMMPAPPEPGDFDRWLAIAGREIGTREARGFMAVTWDGIDGETGHIEPFLADGFELLRSEGLVVRDLKCPPHFDEQLCWQLIERPEDWEATDAVHFDPQWPYGNPQQQRAFIAGQRQQAQAMVRVGLGLRFGIKVGTQLAAELGIYWQDGVGRFNNVSTHPDFRGKGLCQTLVYRAATYVMAHCGVQELVIEAMADSQAGRIYQEVGFEPYEKRCSLQWYNASKT